MRNISRPRELDIDWCLRVPYQKEAIQNGLVIGEVSIVLCDSAKKRLNWANQKRGLHLTVIRVIINVPRIMYDEKIHKTKTAISF